MKVTSYAIVFLTYAMVALVVCLVIRALHNEHTSLALLLAGIVSIYVGAILWRRDAPTASVSQVSLVVGSVLIVICTGLALVLHAIFGWIENPQVEIPVAAVGSFVGTYILLPTVWRTLIGQKASQTHDVEPDG
jgi:hypothetical protein